MTVSYTHLDVYKRQGIGAAELVDQLRDDDGCLLRADAGVLLVSVHGDQEIGRCV